MSCDAIAAAGYLFLASFSTDAAPPPAAPVAAQPANPLASEPLFAGIVQRAGALRAQVQGWKGQTIPAEAFAGFKTSVAELAALDMEGHVLLKARGTDGDLKCILRGISEDLPGRLADVEKAKDGKARDAALTELDYLLRDNVEVILAPPQPAV